MQLDSNMIEKGIIDRTLEVLDRLKASKEIQNIRAFCDKYGFKAQVITRLRQPDNTRKVPYPILFALGKDFNISMDYIIHGSGNWRKK